MGVELYFIVGSRTVFLFIDVDNQLIMCMTPFVIAIILVKEVTPKLYISSYIRRTSGLYVWDSDVLNEEVKCKDNLNDLH